MEICNTMNAKGARISKAFHMAAAALTLAACSPKPTMFMQEQSGSGTALEAGGRVTVTRIGVFADDLAYDDRRGVYLIVDSKTGKEFIGVSGVGITETGRHRCGKNCTSEDER